MMTMADIEDGYKDLVKGDGVYYNSEYYNIMSINTDNGLVESPIDKITIIDEYKGSGSIIEVFAQDIEIKTPVEDAVEELENDAHIHIEDKRMMVVDDVYDSCVNDSNYLYSVLAAFYEKMDEQTIELLYQEAFGDKP